MTLRRLFALALIIASPCGAARIPDCTHTGAGTLFEVGPGQAYASIGAVPWEALNAGDTVRIHWRATPYREKILLRRQGTASQPITVCGVRGPGGERPVLDGENATTRATMGYRVVATEPRGLIHVSWGTGDAWGFKPRHLRIQGLHLRHAFHEYAFSASDGSTQTYSANAAGIFVERGEHVVVSDVVLEGNGNGFFVASGDSEEMLSRDVRIEFSELYGNGTVSVSNDRHHNLYTEAVGMTIQFNRFGPLRAGSSGGNLKDRSTGTVVRYNLIDGGARSIDLVEAQESWPMVQALPEYRRSFVYGNLIVSDPEGPGNLVHYGGDSGCYVNGQADPALACYRKGTLHFFHNTVVVRADQSTRWRSILFDVSTNDERVDARNNLVFLRAWTPGAVPTNLSWMHQYGLLDLGTNWASPTLTPWRDNTTPQGAISGLGSVLTNAANAPGFVDEAGTDFRLAFSSDAVDAGMALHPEVIAQAHTVNAQYLAHAAGQPRPDDGAPDLGAFEYDGGLFADGFEVFSP
ncbi:MAG TPA: hypothetical protein PK361_10150 [Chiayiivirga sp.]|nr:hypothetical protein [Chiayiivirga sp.]